jgi:hypothetical protein
MDGKKTGWWEGPSMDKKVWTFLCSKGTGGTEVRRCFDVAAFVAHEVSDAFFVGH